MFKQKEAEIFRKTKLEYYKKEAQKHPCNIFKSYKKIESYFKNKQNHKQSSTKKHHINVKNPPATLAKEMILNGEYKECSKGYIYVEYKKYKSYLHTLVVMSNGIIIPKGYGIHHIDKNKKNNDIKNLQVVSWEEHRKIHNQKIG